MKKFAFLWLFITNSKFRFWHLYTLEYALKTYEFNKGQGATNVVMFEIKYGSDIFTYDFQIELDENKKKYKLPNNIIIEHLKKCSLEDIDYILKNVHK
jgi:hypothetical protein